MSFTLPIHPYRLVFYTKNESLNYAAMPLQAFQITTLILEYYVFGFLK